jgi:two-component system CheB/CheR fusion protein
VEAVREFFESIVQSIRDPLLVLDAGLRVHLANEAFCRCFALGRKAVEQQSLFELGRRQFDDPQLRQRLECVLRERGSFHDLLVEGDFADAGHKRLRLNGRRLERGAQQPQMVLLMMEDLSEGKS